MRFVARQICYCVDMRRTALLAILAALTLSPAGCRTGNQANQAEQTPAATPAPAPEATATPPPSAPASTDHRPLIVCFGDSLTAGYGAEFGKSYPNYLQADLDAKGYHYRVVNEGISGNTTKDGVERVNDIVAMKPAIVVVEFGGNDGLRGLRIEDSRANLDKIVSTLKIQRHKSRPRRHHPPTGLWPRLHPPVQRHLHTARKKIQRPHAPVLVEGRLRRRRHDAGRQNPRHSRRKQGSSQQHPPAHPPSAQKIIRLTRYWCSRKPRTGVQ